MSMGLAAKKLTAAQCAEAMAGKDFGQDIVGAAANVAVVLTQGWCPQWSMMSSWLDAAAEASGAKALLPRVRQRGLLRAVHGLEGGCPGQPLGSLCPLLPRRRAGGPEQLSFQGRLHRQLQESGKPGFSLLGSLPPSPSARCRSGTSCFLRDSISLSSKVRSSSLGKRSIEMKSLSPSTKRTLDSSVMSVTISALK
ncbi:MAG: hypothetical protein MZV63_46735 [Marinilabiliales bacterium]|nr:hypothetical protein [Marinilabiliales bacterium]